MAVRWPWSYARQLPGGGGPGRAILGEVTFAHILCWSSRSPAASFLCAMIFPASLQLFDVLRFCAAAMSGNQRLLQALYSTPSTCQQLNARIACSLTLCVRRVRRAPLRWLARGTVTLAQSMTPSNSDLVRAYAP